MSTTVTCLDVPSYIYNEPMPPPSDEIPRTQNTKVEPSIFRKIHKPAEGKEAKSQQKVEEETHKVSIKMLSFITPSDMKTETKFIRSLQDYCIGYQQKHSKEYEDSVRKIATKLAVEYANMFKDISSWSKDIQNLYAQNCVDKILAITPKHQYIEAVVILDVLQVLINPEMKFRHSEREDEGCGCSCSIM